MASPRSHWFGIAAMVSATGLFIASDCLMKITVQQLQQPFQVLFMRCLFGFVFCLAIVLASGQYRRIGGAVHRRTLLRSAFDAASTFFYMAALANMPIADTIAIGQTAPLLVIIAVAVIFRERIGSIRLVLVCAGFLGAVLVAQPVGAGLSPAAVFAFLTAISVAMRDLLTRAVPSSIPTFVVLLASSFILMVTTAAAAISQPWVAPSLAQWLTMVVSGLIVTMGQMAIFLAFRRAPASVVAPYYYSFTVWAVSAGFVVWREVPDSLAIVGMTLIVGSGLALLFVRSHQVREAIA